MPVEVFIPKMTEHMETALLTRWLVQPGERVERGQPILEVETDKASAEVESPASGILSGVRVKHGAQVPVGEVVAFIVLPGEAPPSPATDVAVPAKSERDLRSPGSALPKHPQQVPQIESDEVKATPVARRLAREFGVDLREVKGSGPQGRVREEDVRAAFQARQQAAAVTQQASTATASQEWIELTRAQLITGRRMLESVRTAPHYALTTTVDVTETLRWQAELSERMRDTGLRLTLTAILVKACAVALRRYPRASVSFEEGRLRQHAHANIGVAIGTEDGLVVPVIKDADQKELPEIACQIQDYRSRAGEKRLRPDELSGGTFTLSNLGMYGIDQFTAILNPPESAILAVGRARKTPVFMDNGALTPRSLMTLTLSIDHRSLDGVQGARLMSEIRKFLEQPESME